MRQQQSAEVDDGEVVFDEVDLNFINEAVYDMLVKTDWDVTNNDDWNQLVALKNLQTKIHRALDHLAK